MSRRFYFRLLITYLIVISSKIAWSLPKQTVDSRLEEEKAWSILKQSQDSLSIILFRHALAPGYSDPPSFELDDCSTQRNLSEEGRQQARFIGEELKKQAIPITRVLSSQWCRCLETAELMNVGEVEPYSPLNSFFTTPEKAETQTNQLREFLLSNQEETGVIVMVSHQVNIYALTEISPGSGEAVILQVNRDLGKIEVLGRFLIKP